jgi:anti-sigma factor RsiW
MEGERVVGGLRCGEVLSMLDAFVEGSLDPESHAAVVSHVGGCPNCERFGGTYAELAKRIRQAARIEDPGPALLERLRARLDLDGSS